MNWVDLVIIIVLTIFVIDGIRRGFINELVDFISFLIAFFVSIRFYNYLGSFFENSFQIPHSLANILGFVLSWFFIESLFIFIVHLLVRKFRFFIVVNDFFKPVAAIPAFLRGFIFISIIILILGTFPIQPKIKKSLVDSKIGSIILNHTQKLEQPIKNVFGGITQDTLSFLTIKPKSDESIQLGFKVNDSHESFTKEKEMIELINIERQKIGIKKLSFDSNLRDVGRKHSLDMFIRGYFSHYSPEGRTVADRAGEMGISFLVIGENLAYAPTLELAHGGLMNSPGHKANILSEDFNKIGIGIMDGGVYGLMITQVFSN